MHPLHSLQHLQLGSPITAGDLTLYPLQARDMSERAYLTLDEAIADGVADVTEVSEGGSVGQLRITTRANRPVLILDGEELVGAKQNRIVNLTILVAPVSTLDLPVTCVEAGRWGYRSRHFSTSGRTHYASARAMKTQQVSASMAFDGSRCADQNAIWADIAAKSVRMEVFSETQAAEALYDSARASLDHFVQVCRPQPMQVGAIFAIRQRVMGLEVFDSPHTWRKQAEKVIRSYGLDAMDAVESTAGADYRSGPDRFIDAISALPFRESKALGLGTDIRLEDRGLVGAALSVDNRLVHAAAFARRA